jgi:hypothetical protein
LTQVILIFILNYLLFYSYLLFILLDVFFSNLNNFENQVAKEEKKNNVVNLETIIQSLYEDIKDFLIMMKTIDDTISQKLNRKNYTGVSQIKSIFQEIYHYLFDKLKRFLFVENRELGGLFSENYFDQFNRIEKNPIFLNLKFYMQKDSVQKFINYNNNLDGTSDIRFNDIFNKNTLQNISNLLLNIFDLFEIYIQKESIESLYDPKKLMIEQIFFAFLNEKIFYLLNLFIKENSLDSRDTALTINNYCGFTFTKNFLLHLYKSFKSVIKFNLNILKKTSDRMDNYELIYLAFFSVLKCFYLKFVHFYEIEYNSTENYSLLNGLILEIIKNNIFLRKQIDIILTSLFKNIDECLKIKLNDLDELADNLQNLFLDQFIKNQGTILFKLFIINYEDNVHVINMYEIYDQLLIQDKPKSIFNDIRSVLIEMTFQLAHMIRDFYEINDELFDIIKNGNNKIEKIKFLVSQVLMNFFEKLKEFIESKKVLYFTKKKIQYFTQIYFELQLLYTFLEEIFLVNSKTLDAYKELLNILLGNYLELRDFINGNVKEKGNEDGDGIRNDYDNGNGNGNFEEEKLNENLKSKLNFNLNEETVFGKDEINNKNEYLTDYRKKFSKYFNCFKI